MSQSNTPSPLSNNGLCYKVQELEILTQLSTLDADNFVNHTDPVAALPVVTGFRAMALGILRNPHLPTAFLGRESWSEGAKVQGAWLGTGGRGQDRDSGGLRGRCAGGWASFSFRLSCTNAIVEGWEFEGKFPVGFRDLVGKGMGNFDLITQASRESGALCGILPLGVGHME